LLDKTLFSDYFYEANGERSQMYYYADYPIDKHNQIQLRYYNNKPGNPGCYYEDLKFTTFVSMLTERIK